MENKHFPGWVKFTVAGVISLFLTILIATVIYSFIMGPFLNLQFEKIDYKYKDAARRMIADNPLPPDLRRKYWSFMDDRMAITKSTEVELISSNIPNLHSYSVFSFILMSVICTLLTFLIMGFLKGATISVEDMEKWRKK